MRAFGGLRGFKFFGKGIFGRNQRRQQRNKASQAGGQPNTTSTQGGESIAWDRSARMGTFGLFFYGPYQHWWYGLLNRRWPLRTASHFLTKVTLNQVALGPVVTTVVFTWNLLLQQKSSEIPEKLRRDLVPTMVNGWKFWVPAASINFWVIPVQSQVLYMSVCGLLWTAYLSYSSNRPQLVKS